MTTTDPFSEAARAEAERRSRPPGISGQTLPSMEQFAEREGYQRGFADCAEWARSYLAAQEPTDAECVAFFYAFEDLAAETNIEHIRAALSAARRARGGTHEHSWRRVQNVTSKGYAMPPIEVCSCGEVREDPTR